MSRKVLAQLDISQQKLNHILVTEYIKLYSLINVPIVMRYTSLLKQVLLLSLLSVFIR